MSRQIIEPGVTQGNWDLGRLAKCAIISTVHTSERAVASTMVYQNDAQADEENKANAQLISQTKNMAAYLVKRWQLLNAQLERVDPLQTTYKELLQAEINELDNILYASGYRFIVED